ncbi:MULTISPECIES: hypothetical protein [unclassified Ectothiorhodospira]|uniref:hypothetical protein n=1 Tax=unclassified Ectothiorhodospira TaxID=2684909 RepID=UPI001EE82CB1|nr:MULTISPECIES: hypothetical protein [unclassified Ectothiorhodospira]MCG5514758.1 hypothetical protein [Ectothiorhodospira sp. 9100]MCG5518357.1 hypothetical protein [Ectothiorhodospira sp. 9905]
MQHSCPECGADVPGGGSSRCEACALKDRIRRRVRLNAELLEQPWVRSLFGGFCAWQGLPKKAGNMTARIDRYAVFFADIDRHCMVPAEITQGRLFEIFGAERLRRGFLIVSFLCERLDIEWDMVALEDMIEAKRMRLQAQAWRDRPWALGLQRFVEELEQRKGPVLKRKTIRMYQAAAGGFLEKAGVNSPEELTQADLHQYLKRYPGQAANVSIFVRHLNATLGIELEVKYKPQTSLMSKGRKLVDRVQAIAKQLDEEGDESRCKVLLVGLLADLFRIPVKEVLFLKIDDVVEDSSGFLLWPESHGLRIEGCLAEHFRRCVFTHSEGEMGFLFKGRNRRQPLSYDTVRYHLRASSKEIPDASQ